MGNAPVLSKPLQGETLVLYMAISEAAVSDVFIRVENKVELLVFYVSKSLLDLETRYPDTEKITLALVMAARKLRPYFQAHPILAYSSALLRKILQNPECFGRLTKWAIELSEFYIEFKPRVSIKGQAIADFILEFTRADSVWDKERGEKSIWSTHVWKFFVDGSTNWEGAGIRIILEKPNQRKIEKAFILNFSASNNEAEYEALLTGLKLAKDLDIRAVHVFCDSKRVSSQVNAEFEAREPRMMTYLQHAQNLITGFDSFQVTHIPRAKNSKADRLARIGSGIDQDLFFRVEILESSSIHESSVNIITKEISWMTLIMRYLEKEKTPRTKSRQGLSGRRPFIMFTSLGSCISEGIQTCF